MGEWERIRKLKMSGEMSNEGGIKDIKFESV
jgi:hypothetical protein